MKVSSLVKSAVIGSIFILPVTAVQAADGCKFLLCMGAPNPMGIAECAGTVREVLRDLARGKSLPTCSLAGSSEGGGNGSYVNYSSASHIPPCPSGTHYGQDQVYYHQGNTDSSGGYKTNIDQGQSVRSGYKKYQSRVCVGGQKLSASTRKKRVDGSIVNERHEWWEQVSIVKPDGAKYQFRMFIDGQLHSNHRF